jgi:23S rRNA pseudouridine955/2504/2580 synthase
MEERSPQNMASPNIVAVGPESDGQRLDNFLLRRLKPAPRSLVYRLVRKGAVRVNGRRARVDQRVQSGDQVRLPVLTDPPRAAEAISGPVAKGWAQRLEAAVIDEDEDFLVLDKPAGLAVHAGSGLGYGLIELLRQQRPDAMLELGHRLDRDTSGCIVVAKSRRGLQALHSALRAGQVQKRYVALLAGVLERPVQECNLPIARADDGSERRRMRAGPAGTRPDTLLSEGKPQAARSRFEVLESWPGFSLVGVDIGTGRTHQIRVHAQALGCPVVGDDVYGVTEVNRRVRKLGLRRQFLHAQSLRFPDWNGEMRVYNTDLSADLVDFLKRIRN